MLLRPSAPGARRRSRLLATGALLAAAAGALVAARVPEASGAYVAKVVNSADTAAANPYFTCNAAVNGETGTKALFSWPFSDTPTAAAQTLAVAVPINATDATGNNKLGTYTANGVTYNVADPAICPRDKRPVITLDGASGFIGGYPLAATATPIAGPQVFSEEIWFKTTTKQGRLIGFGNSLNGTSSNYDRHLYIDTNGLIRFGAYDGGNTHVIVSPAPRTGGGVYTDGTWHYAAASLSSAGMKLWVDGLPVGSDPNTIGQTFTGYWRVGYDNLNNWSGIPAGNQQANYYFRGSLAWASVYGYVLSDAQVAHHYAAGRS